MVRVRYAHNVGLQHRNELLICDVKPYAPDK